MEEEASEKLAQLQHENTKLQNDLIHLQSQMYSLEEHYYEVNETLSEKKNEIKSLKQGMSVMSQELKEKELLIESLQEIKESITETKNQLTSENHSLKVKLHEEKLKNKEIELLKIREEELKNACTKAQEQYSRLLSELSIKTKEHSLCVFEVNSLQLQIKIPILGLGTWKSKPGEVTQAVKDAIDIGYRHFDCAHIYQNEKEVGAAITEKIQREVVRREEIWVTSKLWNTDHHPSLVEKALRVTLSNLNLEYLDLYLIHWPHGFKEGPDLFPVDENGSTLFSDVDYVETWKAMEECVRKGLTKSIGLSNFNSEQVQRICNIASIRPVVNQVECHPYLTQKKMAEFCKKLDIVLTAYSPLGSPDRPWAKPDEPKLLDQDIVKNIAAKYGKSPAQVLIRYQIERGHVTIPKSVTRKRIQENFEVFDFKLNSEDIKMIDSFDRNGRLIVVNNAKAHKYYPFNLEF